MQRLTPHARGLRPIYGADKVTRFFVGLVRKFSARAPRETSVDINGESGLLLAVGGKICAALTIATDGQRLIALDAV